MIQNPFGTNGDKPKHGICPLSSTVTAVPEAVPGGVVSAGPGQQAVAIRTLFMPAPCVAADCQLWDGHAEMCGLKTIPAVSNALEGIIPASGVDRDKVEAFLSACTAYFSQKTNV